MRDLATSRTCSYTWFLFCVLLATFVHCDETGIVQSVIAFGLYFYLKHLILPFL